MTPTLPTSLKEFGRLLEEYLKEHPVSCPDCGHYLMVSHGSIHDTVHVEHLHECPECGWPVKPDLEVQA